MKTIILIMALLCGSTGIVWADDEKRPEIIEDYLTEITPEFFKKIDNISTESKRGEFETSAEYKKRMSSIEKNQNGFIIILKTHDYEFKYDIDKQMYKYDGGGYIYDNCMEIINNVITINKGSYNGTNIFGLNTQVNKEREENYGIKIIGLNKKFKKNYSFAFSFKMNPESAKKLKDNMCVMLDVVPVKNKGSYTTYNLSWHSPTFSEPVDRESEKRLINVKLKKIYILDKRTFDVVVTIPAETAK